MLSRQISRAFARLTRPRISKYRSVFELMRDRTDEINFIDLMNAQIYNANKNVTVQQQLLEQFDVSEKASFEISQEIIHTTAYSPIWMKPFRISQKYKQNVAIEDPSENVEIPYSPGHEHLKFHYSINRDVPVILDYASLLNKNSVIIFRLPKDITESKIKKFLKGATKVKIHYCKIGLPAFAVVQFSQEFPEVKQVNIDGIQCPIVNETNLKNHSINRRQLVLQKLDENQTPANLLNRLSAYGRVVDLDMPMEIYKQPSMTSIKQLYKNQASPIKINFHRSNGTIESEYYPPFNTKNIENLDQFTKLNLQYKRRLRYCENIDIYEGEQDKIKTRSKGMCFVTFSCVQEAQNCYLQMRMYQKIDLRNDREQFEFDTKHRENLLRFVDNQYIEKKKNQNPDQYLQEKEEELDSFVFQSFFLNLIHENLKMNFYDNSSTLDEEDDDSPIQQFYNTYKAAVNDLRKSIGKGNLDMAHFSEDNRYGKSFDELAEQELYGLRLKRDRKKRYQIDIDDYERKKPEFMPMKDDGDDLQMDENGDLLDEQQQLEILTLDAEDAEEKENFSEINEIGEDEEQIQQAIIETSIDNDADKAEGKRKFSTFKERVKSSRPKTFQQKVRSHMNYNKFVRNVINEYMGIFSAEKLESEFYRKKPTYVNLQSLKFKDGSDFISETEVANILEYSTKPSQIVLNNFVRQNQIVKSLNIDVQEKMLKNFDLNLATVLEYYTDVGAIVEEYKYTGNKIEETVADLNRNKAEFGEEYQNLAYGNSDRQKIVKIKKLQSIVPLDILDKMEKDMESFEASEEFDAKKLKMIEKYEEYLLNGKPLPNEFAQYFGLQPGSVLDIDHISDQICSSFDLKKKDFEKLLNLGNYTEEQIKKDISRHIEIGKIKRRKEEKRASNYSRDPSLIRVKGKDGKYVVSKFRQV